MGEERWINFKDFCTEGIKLRKDGFVIWDEVMAKKFGIIKPFKADIEKRIREHPGNEQPLFFDVQFHWLDDNGCLTCVTPPGAARMESVKAAQTLPAIW